MAQSDYIQRKKIQRGLASFNQKKEKRILDSENYTLYKQYSLENTIPNNSHRYNQLIPNGTKIIMGMETSRTATCPSFVLCKNTDTRPSHTLTHPIAFNPHVSSHLPYVNSYTVSYVPNQLKYIKHRPIRKCDACCYDSSYNKTHTNNHNTWFSVCSNHKLRKIQCDCSMN